MFYKCLILKSLRSPLSPCIVVSCLFVSFHFILTITYCTDSISLCRGQTFSVHVSFQKKSSFTAKQFFGAGLCCSFTNINAIQFHSNCLQLNNDCVTLFICGLQWNRSTQFFIYLWARHSLAPVQQKKTAFCGDTWAKFLKYQLLNSSCCYSTRLLFCFPCEIKVQCLCM